MSDAARPWPLNAWYQAGWSHDVTDAPLARTLLGEAVVFFRDGAGELHALEDRCCHRATPLSLGEVVQNGLQCGYHGLVFGGDGRCVEIPGQETVPPQACVRSYPVVERQEMIWLWPGDPAAADENLIVDYPYNDDHDNWPHVHGMYHVACSYLLMIDNLMDMTHVPFIHRNTIGAGVPAEQVNASMDVTRTDRGLRYIRWMTDSTPPPTYIEGVGWPPDVRVDRWLEFEFVAPSTVIQWTGALETGRGAQENRRQPGGFSLRNWHGVTPETESSCHYFWCPANGYRPDDADATARLHRDIAATLAEDIEFLERQQETMSADPARPLVDIRHDAALKPARRTIERMIGAESTSAAAE